MVTCPYEYTGVTKVSISNVRARLGKTVEAQLCIVHRDNITEILKITSPSFSTKAENTVPDFIKRLRTADLDSINVFVESDDIQPTMSSKPWRIEFSMRSSGIHSIRCKDIKGLPAEVISK